MKQFLSSILSKAKSFLSAAAAKARPFLRAVLARAKQFLASALDDAKQLLSSGPFDRKKFLSSSLFKLLVLILILLLVLIIGLAGRSADEAPSSYEPLIGTVSVDDLDVHKKPEARSRVLSRLPQDLDIEILEEQTDKETTWGRIDAMELPDGSKSKAGWIDLQHVSFEPEIPLEIVEPEPEPEPPAFPNMGTITASKLHVRTGPGSNYDSTDAYYKGDRVEILETQTVEETVWGRTHLGWVGMGYVRLDGTYTSDSIVNDNPDAPKVISDGNTSVLGYGIVTLNELNVRLGNGTIYGKTGTITIGNRYAYYQLLDGWARIEDGWVSTEHFYIEGTANSDAFPAVVNTEELNIRTGPKTTYSNIGTYAKGEQIEILAKFGDWGYTEKGWVYLEYVDPNYSTGAGTITNGLNIRTEPDANSELVGTYTIGDRVTITEVEGSWGLTDKGWINLKYVKYD